jgi:ankyrin repeat protein
VDAIRWLVEHGADPRVRDTVHASTPLGWADFNGKAEVVEYLKAHAEPDIVDATIMGLTEKVLHMLDSDPGLAQGFPGASPLRAAAYTGNRTLVEAFLEAGADPGDPNPETGLVAVDIARQRGHRDIVTLLQTWKGLDA